MGIGCLGLISHCESSSTSSSKLNAYLLGALTVTLSVCPSVIEWEWVRSHRPLTLTRQLLQPKHWQQHQQQLERMCRIIFVPHQQTSSSGRIKDQCQITFSMTMSTRCWIGCKPGTGSNTCSMIYDPAQTKSESPCYYRPTKDSLRGRRRVSAYFDQCDNVAK